MNAVDDVLEALTGSNNEQCLKLAKTSRFHVEYVERRTLTWTSKANVCSTSSITSAHYKL